MKKFLFRLNDSIWLTPTLFAIFSALLALATVMIDTLYIGELTDSLPYFLLTSVDLAQTILGTIAGALLTMTTITFSTIMVVLTTYSSQFSPRVLKNFITDKMTMRVLGIFMGGFVYSILSLLFMREASIDHNVISAVVGVAFAVVCLAFFAYFIHNVATSIQVSYLVSDLAADVHDVISSTRKLIENYTYIKLGEKPLLLDSKKVPVYSDSVGFIQMIEFERLLQKANHFKGTIEVHFSIGEFVTKDDEVLTLHGEDAESISLSEYVVIGNEPSSTQDINYAMQKIVEIALRAISPGINDPNTAILCIRHIGGLLPLTLEVNSNFVQLSDVDGKVIYPQLSTSELMHSTFSGIAHYGKEDVNVLLAVLDAYRLIPDRIVRQEMAAYTMAHYNEKTLQPLDQQVVAERLAKLER